jgi:hypothetical protein
VAFFNNHDACIAMNENPIVRMFEWWNAEFSDPEGFSPQAFGLHYCEDARLMVNGNLRGQGYEALSRHYRKLQSEFDSIQMELPVLDQFSCGDRAFVQCVTRAISSGNETREEAMAVAKLSSGRIAFLNVLGRKLE